MSNHGNQPCQIKETSAGGEHHRLSTIRDADEIIVLSEEGIEQRGTHDELIRQPGMYAALYNARLDDDVIGDQQDS